MLSFLSFSLAAPQFVLSVLLLHYSMQDEAQMNKTGKNKESDRLSNLQSLVFLDISVLPDAKWKVTSLLGMIPG